MQMIITDAWLAKSRPIYLTGPRLVAAGLAASLVLMLVAAGLYHWVFLKGAREGWPVIGSLVKLVVKDEFEQRDRFMRENLDVMAKRLGEMQAKMLQLEALGERALRWAHNAETKVRLGTDSLPMFLDLLLIRWNELAGKYPRRKEIPR